MKVYQFRAVLKFLVVVGFVSFGTSLYLVLKTTNENLTINTPLGFLIMSLCFVGINLIWLCPILYIFAQEPWMKDSVEG